MLEWTASVMIATEPVTAPATSLSTISVRLEAIDSAAARRLRGMSSARVPSAGTIASVRQPGEQRAHGASAVADRVLLGVAQLGHRAVGRAVVGQEGGVVAEAALAARLLRERARAALLEDVLLTAGGVDLGERADVRDRAAGRRLAQQLREVLAVAGVLSRVARGADPRPAAERGRLDPGVVGDRDAPGRGCRRARLAERVLGERRAVLGRQLDARRAAGRSRPRPAPRAARTRAACGRCASPAAAARASGGATAASWWARRRSIPSAASASSSSRCARESGVRSAVACTSTRPPSAVITTFASTSAVESSG